MRFWQRLLSIVLAVLMAFLVAVFVAVLSVYAQDTKAAPSKADKQTIAIAPEHRLEVEKRILLIENARLRVQLAQTEMQAAETAAQQYMLDLYRTLNLSTDEYQFDAKNMAFIKR